MLSLVVFREIRRTNRRDLMMQSTYKRANYLMQVFSPKTTVSELQSDAYLSEVLE